MKLKYLLKKEFRILLYMRLEVMYIQYKHRKIKKKLKI